MLNVVIKDDCYVLTMASYDVDLVDFCRNLQRARYHLQAKCWTAVRNVPNALDLHSKGYFSDTETLNSIAAVAPLPTPMLGGEDLWRLQPGIRPFIHQIDWGHWATRVPKAMLIADMGLGKTLMAMMWWQGHKVAHKDLVIICPVSLIQNWQSELRTFLALDAIPVLGTASQKGKAVEQSGVHIISYETFIKNQEALQNKTAVVIDESHKIKTPTAQRSKALHCYCAQPQRKFVLCLTGTPITQGAQDYFSQFKTINQSLLGASFTSFKKRYCIEEQIRGAPFGVKKIIGYQKVDELSRLIAPYTRTYRKDECLDLPPKTYTARYVSLSDEQRRVYQELKYEMATSIKDGEPITAANILTRLIRFSQVAQGFITQEDNLHKFNENPKLKALEECIEELNPQESFIVICRFKQDILNVLGLMASLKIQCGIISGDVLPESRLDIVNKFQSGDFRCLIGQIATTGVGFTLTKASTMVFYSNSYSLVDRLQAEDRIHRIGTKGTCCYVDIIAKDTVDEDVVKALRSKKDVAEMLFEMRHKLVD